MLALLLTAGGLTNEAWGIKVTYHILTLPFTTKNATDGNLTDRCANIRVEAVKVIVNEDSPIVGLPAHFKSPLAQNFKYYASDKVTKLTKASPGSISSSYFDDKNRAQIYQYMTTKYDLYVINGTADNAALPDNDANLLTVGGAIASDCDIYVTYEYNPTNGIVKLDGSQEYNIKLGDRFLCFNKDRANRPGAVLASKVTEENLTSNNFTYIANPGFNGDKNHYFHFRFKFEGSDPYNITLRTAYNGDETFNETDKALNKTVKKWYKGASLFCQGTEKGTNNMWLSSDDDKQYTQTDVSASSTVTYVSKPGFFRGGNGGTSEMNPIFNSLAMLNADNGDGYVFMATKTNTNGNNWHPNNDGQYLYLTGNVDNGNNPRFQLKKPALAESTDPEIYEIRTYTYKVKTPLTNQVLEATVTMSEYLPEASLLTHVPAALRRKYVTFTGTYKEETLSTEMTTFGDVETADNGRVIWLKYESSMPFESLSSGGSYEDARWYTLRMNGQAENQYIGFYDTSNSNHYSTGRGSNIAGQEHVGENSPEAMVAFIGDPFELKIINRKTSEDNGGNQYIGCATAAADGTALTSQTGSSDISSWEIVNDDITGTIILRQLGSAAAPMYIGWDYSANAEGRPMTYSSTASRIKVMELEKKNYVYHIINAAGNVAVKMTEAQDVGTPLRLKTIPNQIRSPFLALLSSSYISYYWSKTDADANTNAKTHAAYDPATEGYDIYVKYDGTAMATALASYRVHFHTDQYFNVRLNTQYLYFYKDGEGNKNINSKETITDEQAASDAYKWRLEGKDPYNMKVYNEGAYQDNTTNAESYINTTFANNEALTFDVEANAKSFIALSGTVESTFEVMAATGDTLDVATNYYNIGRNADNSVKMFQKATAPHGSGTIRFVLTQTNANVIYYHLIDKKNEDLLQARSRHEYVYFPVDYRSPLVGTYHYYATEANALAGTSELTENAVITTLKTAGTIADRNEDGNLDIYVTYDTNNSVNLQKGALYLLKFLNGETVALENGSDGFSSPVKAIYPYCNGDCNFFIYGQDQYDLQQEGAASTRTRWAWYLESTNNDPYHVKICSRQLETYNSSDNRGYFCTYVENFSYPGEDAANHVITGLVWPGITGDQATEYMVLGATGHYQLVTSAPINDGTTDERRIVNSFEQYWKTFDTIRKKVFGESKPTANVNDPSIVPATPAFSVTTAAGLSNNRTYLMTAAPTGKGYHHYSQWAYAKRWNGYNISGKTSKGWEDIEHWYQTIDMGEGYFDLVPTSIDPALILLDQHGWEIMRKPLPTSPDDPTKPAKYNAIRPYNSPMVKEYIFWSSAKKRTGMHQYYLMDKRIGGDYTSTDLTQLPPYGSANVLDAKGNLNDQYVTYIVKDEYAQSYVPSAKAGAQFLLQQGDKYVYNNSGAIAKESVPTGGMPQYVVDNISTIYETSPEAPALGTKALWYIKPNTAIDTEMGYTESNHSWGSSNPNAYEDELYKNNRVAGFITGSSTEAKALIKKYGSFTFSNGFDPYNIQITSVADNTKLFVTNATGATLTEGEMDGTYSTTPEVTLGAEATGVTATWYDNLTQHPTNTTFMAVQDASGNMQLMPRFDHRLRVRDFTKIETPVATVDDDDKLEEMQTQLFRPMVYNYFIIDNTGRESLRYRSAGELTPFIPDHFKSPLAKDYAFYKTLLDEDEDGTYELTTLNDKITGSLAGANLTATSIDGNKVYVRYDFDANADANNILKGKWFTMQLNEKDAKYDSGIKQGTSKPATVNKTCKEWQWKLLEKRTSDPDPYAISLYNRSQAESTKAIDKRFALLSHTSGGYALAEAGTKGYTYAFLNGSDMNTTTNAATATEAGFLSMSCSFDGTKSQMKLLDDVEHEYTYKVYTNGTSGSNAVKYGTLAVSGTQTQAEASQNEFLPVIPEAIRTPLLNIEDFLFYEAEADMGDNTKELPHLYGLYDDEVYVRYKPYSDVTSTYKVPNDKDTEDGHVARGASSNDASLMLDGSLLYNIVWYNDNMMKNDGDNVKGHAGQDLQSASAYEWTFEGGDPYAIKIKSNNAAKYINASATLDIEANAQTFMLLPKDGYDYGVLAMTGDKTNMLTMADDSDAETLDNATIGTGDPTKFVIFALATHKVIYHLVLANIGSSATIDYRAGTVASPEGDLTTTSITGTTLRDLTTTTTVTGDTYQLGNTINGQTYSFDAGPISLGDQLTVPDVFYRPNVVYSFYVEGVYSNDDCAPEHALEGMNSKYKGFKIDKMGDDNELLGRTVRINIVYSFNGELETNAGEGFITDVANDKKWYTVETTDNSGTPWLVQYTNAWGLEAKSGRGSHYTNDYLWAPLGDPYGFKFYNRYIYVNSGTSNAGETDQAMIPESALANPYSADIKMTKGSHSSATAVFELLSAPTDGYFRVHPVVNNSGDQYYLKTVREDGGSVSVKLSSSATEFTFGLSKDLVKPYFDKVGYVGGLKKSVYDDNTTLANAMKGNGELTTAQLMAAQALVYNPANIQPFTAGYYRLHSPDDITGIMEERYASGYTHQLELDYDGNASADADGDGNNQDAIPMHFYEKKDVTTMFENLGSGFTSTNATRGEMTINAVEYDPASIFYISGTDEKDVVISTQGLYIKGTIGRTEDNGSNEATVESTSPTVERAKAVMTTTAGEATHLWIMDIGGGVMLIHDRSIPRYRKYLSYDQTDAAHIYDLKLTHNTNTDEAKWCLQPANSLGLHITTHSGGDEGTYGTSYNYASFYAPFDILLPEDDEEQQEGLDMKRIYQAFILDSNTSPWSPPSDLHPRSIGHYNTVDNAWNGNDRLVPAGTPVLFAIWDQTDVVKVTLPNTSPSTSLTTGLYYYADKNDASPTACSNILTGTYLEQKLSGVANTERIFTFGMQLEASSISLDPETGTVTTVLAHPASAGIGFYLNANPDKELGTTRGSWTRNNRYVYGNKVYYKASGFPSSSRRRTEGISYVPTIFDDDIDNEEQQEELDNSSQPTADECIYDLQGRCVANQQQVKDGTWRTMLKPGIYILYSDEARRQGRSGRKFRKK